MDKKSRRVVGIVDGLLALQKHMNGLYNAMVDATTMRDEPTCSRCLGSLEWDVEAGRYRCVDGCASVATRWKLAARRLADEVVLFSGLTRMWGRANRRCSRCGMPLLGYRMPSTDNGSCWCPGCGPVDGNEMCRNWNESQRIAREAAER